MEAAEFPLVLVREGGTITLLTNRKGIQTELKKDEKNDNSMIVKGWVGGLVGL